jgi:putative serine protease PepD
MTSQEPTPSDDWRPWGPDEEPAGPGSAPTGEADAGTSHEPAWAAASGGSGERGPRTEEIPTRPPSPHAPPSGTQGPDPFPWYQAAPQPTPERTSRRRGPGWGALVGTSLAAALLAGTGGGVVGAYLAANGALEETGAPQRAAPQPGVGATTRPEGSVANIAANATPSVVTLRVRASDGAATGSGWVYDNQGHIVTNNHVVAGSTGQGDITVVLANGQQLEGSVIGRDASYDLAVVEVDRTDLTPLRLGRSGDVVVGDEVVAVGAPLGLDSTVTSGIVSALDRPVTPGEEDDQSFINAIQTDAAINPGNSGGPLLDMNGDVIGVNTAIARVSGSVLSGQSGNIGVGFAIPSDQVSITVEQLIATGQAEHPVIGVYLDSRYDGEGVRIADGGPGDAPAVSPGGPADDAGLRAGDVIVAFEGTPVSEQGELVVKIRARRIGDEVTLTIRRDGTDQDVTMVLQGSGE